jgi:hypothetical protein
MEASPEIPCQRCNGSGHERLSGDLFDVLLVARKRKRVSAGDTGLNGHGPISNFQLEKLRGFGLMTRTKENRKWVYRIV